MAITKHPDNDEQCVGYVDQPCDMSGQQWYYQRARRSGFCNRLRGLIGLAAAAKVNQVQLCVHWQPDRWCPGAFTDVFLPSECVALADHSFAPAGARVFDGRDAVRPARWFRCLSHMDTHSFDMCVFERGRALRLRPVLAAKLAEFLDGVPDNVIGVHVRRTDFAHKTVNSDRLLLRKLYQLVDCDPSVRFLVCADNKDSVMWLRRKFGKRIVWRQQQFSANKERHTTLADAALDLYTLAHAKELVGHPLSSFVDCALILGGAKLHASG